MRPATQPHRLSQIVPLLKFSPVQSPSPTLDVFDSKDVYILDDYGNAHNPVVYVWVGKDVADAKARIALANGGVPEGKEG
ncbi:hypothetical protein J3R83DRAFT_12887 [Lanmaoa asiatica]|nr:hypothetical protein J3R83DRAFT_12887 [Lanmaoa asiatica]